MLKNNRCDFVYDCTFINIHLTSGKIHQDSKMGKLMSHTFCKKQFQSYYLIIKTHVASVIRNEIYIYVAFSYYIIGPRGFSSNDRRIKQFLAFDKEPMTCRNYVQLVAMKSFYNNFLAKH